MSRQQHIPGAGHGFFATNDRAPRQPLVKGGSGQGHQQAQQLLSQNPPATTTLVRDDQNPHAGGPSSQVAHPEDDLSDKEQDKLLDLEHEASKADMVVNRLQRKLNEARADAQRKHDKVDEARRRIEQDRQQSHVQAHLERLPRTTTSTFVPHPTIPTIGKRHAAERDFNDVDSNGERRRVRQRTGPTPTAMSQQALAYTSKPPQGKGSPVPRRHEHPSAHIRSSGSSCRRNGPQTISTYTQYPLQSFNGVVPYQQASHVAHLPQNDQIQALQGGNLHAEGACEVVSQSSPELPSEVPQHNPQGYNVEGSWGDPMGFAHAHGMTQPGSSYNQPQAPSGNALHPVQSLVPRHPNNPPLGVYPINGSSDPTLQRPLPSASHAYHIDPRTGIAPEHGSGTPDWNSNDRKPTVKRQIRRQKLLADGKDIPKDGEKERGKVGFDNNGNLFVELNGKLEPAAYHHERRHGLLMREAKKGQYTQGIHPDDKTAFHEAYANIDMRVRERRPGLLYQWDPPEKQAPCKHPGYMRDPSDNKLLLDLNGHVIIDWPELPKTISGQIEGLWLEYWWRLNRHISTENMLARCPKMTQKGPKTKDRPLPGISAYGNRRERDRLLIGTRAWEEKEGSSLIKSRMRLVMPNRVLAEIAQHGTTSTWRDLKNNEISAICHVNRGQGSAQSRAGDRKLSEEEKAGIDQKKDAVLEQVFANLLQEKIVQDAQDQATRYIGGGNTGSSSVVAAAETTQSGAGTNAEHDDLDLLQYAGQNHRAGTDSTMSAELFNRNGSNFVHDEEQGQLSNMPMYSNQVTSEAQLNNHQMGYSGTQLEFH
ncbi:MAG: hypothetical protein Q9224_002832, partial [Gallowayella concinna]